MRKRILFFVLFYSCINVFGQKEDRYSSAFLELYSTTVPLGTTLEIKN